MGYVSIVNVVNMNVDISNFEKNVECYVEVVFWWECYISVSIRVEVFQEQVWEVLIDYGRLVEFIFNFICRCGVKILNFL